MRIFNALRWLHPGGSKRVTTLVPSIAHLSSTINSAGTGIVLTYSLPVVIGAGGSDGHVLTMSGGPVTMTYLSGSGTSSLTFSLSRTVAAVEGAGTISYTQPVSGIEEAVFRVDVDSWTGRAVVNNSTAIPPPSLVSATLNAAGSTISLLYSAAVHIGTSGPGGHTLSMSGGASTMTYASGDDTTILVYNLSRAITIAETGTLAFAQPSNGLEALAGGADLSSFSGFAVVNASTAPPTVLTAALNSAGTSLTLTYTSAVRIGAGGNAGHVLTASGGASAPTYASGAGSAALVYTLSRTVISSETATLAYTQPANGVESTTVPNPDVMTYSGRTVTNGSTQVAPTRTSASIPAAGTSISIVYSQSVTFGAGGNGGNVITASGGASTLTYASGSGSNTLVYNLSRPIISGETVTLAYTQPGSGIESAASLADVATFSGAAVTNSSLNSPPVFTQASPPSGTIGVAYSYQFVATGAVSYSLVSGTIPAGLTLSSSGLLSGTPTTAAAYSFTVGATNAFGTTTTAESVSVSDTSDFSSIYAANDSYVAGTALTFDVGTAVAQSWTYQWYRADGLSDIVAIAGATSQTYGTSSPADSGKIISATATGSVTGLLTAFGVYIA